MTSLEDVEPVVLKWLSEADADTLQKVCSGISLVIPPDKAGKKYLILRLLLKHLHSDEVEQSEDEGLSTFLKISTDLEIVHKSHVKVEDVHNVSTGLGNLETNMAKFSVQRLREFKISGTVGGVDQRDTLSYTGLSFQMKKGREIGYSSSEIHAAVIKAIKPGSNLRNYLESKCDISETAFIKILRSHFKEKDASSVFQEMSNSWQLPNESELDFCLRVMSLREKVMVLSVEEDCIFDEELVQKKFFRTLFTGLKHNSVRMALQNILKIGDLNDEDLLNEISLVVYNESEHLSKQKSKGIENLKKSTDLFNVNAIENLPEKDRKKDNPLLLEIQKLSAKVSQLSSIQDEMATLKKKFDDNIKASVSGGNQNQSTHFGEQRRNFHRRIYRCTKCEELNRNFCNHCFLCGSLTHKKNECPNHKKN